MPDGIEFSLRGFEEVRRKLEQVPIKLRTKGSRRALGRAAAIVRKAARQNALRLDDVETGRRIADNVAQRVRSSYSRRTGDAMVSVGVLTQHGRIPKGNPDTGRGAKGNTPHWHLVEEGTERARAQPFLRPALTANISQVIDKFAVELDKEMDKALRES